jgi:hypothetical protein
VDFVVLVAPAPSAFPIQLVITDPHDVRLYAFEGKAGKPLRATVEVGR